MAEEREKMHRMEEEKETGQMTVQEAGHLGGEKGGKKGGETVKKKYGPEFYSDIGHKGGEVRGRQIHEAAEYFREHPEELPREEEER